MRFLGTDLLDEVGTSAFAGGGGGGSVTSALIDFGADAVGYKEFTITDPAVSPTSKILVSVGYRDDLGREVDETLIDPIHLLAIPGTGEFTLKAMANCGRVSGKYGVTYSVG